MKVVADRLSPLLSDAMTLRKRLRVNSASLPACKSAGRKSVALQKGAHMSKEVARSPMKSLCWADRHCRGHNGPLIGI